jgi:hypothetical protein
VVDITKTKYQWLVTSTWDVLHYVAEVADWDDAFFKRLNGQCDGTRPWKSACGIAAHFEPPGIFSRMDCPRCQRCCKAVGITQGNGCPINDETCKEIS